VVQAGDLRHPAAALGQALQALPVDQGDACSEQKSQPNTKAEFSADADVIKPMEI
jgi:hypothetical protein